MWINRSLIVTYPDMVFGEILYRLIVQKMMMTEHPLHKLEIIASFILPSTAMKSFD